MHFLPLRERIEAEGGSDFGDVVSELHDLLSTLQEIKRKWEDIESGTAQALQPYMIKGQGRGCLMLFISKEQITFLCDLRFLWTQIASLFGVSR